MKLGSKYADACGSSSRRADVHLPVALCEVIRRIERENYLPVQSRVSRSRPGKGENEAEIDRPFLSRAERAARVQPRRRATYYHRLGAVGVGAGACERCDICGVSLSLIASGRELVHVPAYIQSPRLTSFVRTLQRACPPRDALV
ncbi:hypothetical protein ACS0PU_009806 [Formica fusca]